MVKPSSRAGQRRSAISLRTIRGRLGAMSAVSAARAATAAVAVRRINFRLVVGRRGNRFQALTLQDCAARSPLPRITRIRGFAIYRVNRLRQKLNVACNSILRLAAVPGENGPP